MWSTRLLLLCLVLVAQSLLTAQTLSEKIEAFCRKNEIIRP